MKQEKQSAYKVCRRGLTPAPKTNAFIFDFLPCADDVWPSFFDGYECHRHWQKYQLSRFKNESIRAGRACVHLAQLAANCEHTFFTFGNKKLFLKSELASAREIALAERA